MKRCPKCSRSFPDDNQKFCTIDGGLLVLADKPFDPNATIQGTSASQRTPPAEPPKEKPASSSQPDFSATIATTSSAPTAVLPRKTGPTNSPTSSNLQQPSKANPAPPPHASVPPPATVATPPRTQSAPLPPSKPLPQRGTVLPVPVAPQKKSKLPLILGILAILLILGVGAIVAAFFLLIKPRLDRGNPERPVVVRQSQTADGNSNANPNNEVATAAPEKTESEFVAPANTTKFTNSKENLDGKLAEHYLDFSFYYPDNWIADPKAGVPGASNFAKVERRLPPDLTQENFAVGWYTSKGTFAADEATFPQLVEVLGKSLANAFPGYRKVSEGRTQVNSLDGYEFRFVSVSKGTDKGDIQVWGRVIFLPTGTAGDQSGATLVMLASSLAPELSGVEDVGEKGEVPVVLESFRFAKPR